MATFLLQEYFDQPTTTNTDHLSPSKPLQVIIPNTIKESHTDIDDVKSDEDFYSDDHSESFSDHHQ